ncbi:hypothetical protein ACRAWG_06210 [Methylobacterium sp. P31]
MNAGHSDPMMVERLAAFLLEEALIDFAAAMRCGGASEARSFLFTLEQRFARALLQVWTDTPAGRSNPDIIAAVALRLRKLIREERQLDPRVVHAA